MYVCLSACVIKRERGREKERKRQSMCVCVYIYKHTLIHKDRGIDRTTSYCHAQIDTVGMTLLVTHNNFGPLSFASQRRIEDFSLYVYLLDTLKRIWQI